MRTVIVFVMLAFAAPALTAETEVRVKVRDPKTQKLRPAMRCKGKGKHVRCEEEKPMSEADMLQRVQPQALPWIEMPKAPYGAGR